MMDYLGGVDVMIRIQEKLLLGRHLTMVALAALLLGGFAGSFNPMNSLEGFDRAVFALNDDLDKIVINTAAQGYEVVMPRVVQHGARSFFANVGDILIATNELLPGKVSDVVNDIGRVLVNTTLGVLGFRDVASGLGIENHERISVRLSAPQV